MTPQTGPSREVAFPIVVPLVCSIDEIKASVLVAFTFFCFHSCNAVWVPQEALERRVPQWREAPPAGFREDLVGKPVTVRSDVTHALEQLRGLYPEQLLDLNALCIVDPAWHNKDKWDVCFPGGKRHMGETSRQCALRELREVRPCLVCLRSPRDVRIARRCRSAALPCGWTPRCGISGIPKLALHALCSLK